MSFPKLTYIKIFLTFVLFISSVYFFFPINVNAICAIGQDCPILTAIIRVTDLNSTPSYVSINYWIILAYLIIEYIIASAIITLSGRGGSISLAMKK